MTQKNSKSSSIPDFDVVKALLETFHSAINAGLWGKETTLPKINMKIINDWFRIQKRSHPRGKYGVLYAKIDASTNSPRFYQGFFDYDWKCLGVRQIVSDDVDEEVRSLVEEKDLILFDPEMRPVKQMRTSDGE